jgi:hypothetical protein
MNITEKTAIVTGGSRGIGRAIAVELAKAGVQIAIIYAGNTAAAEETLALVKAQGVQGMMIQCDVADGAAVEAMVKEVKDTFGSIDILVNNAGITRDTLLMRMKETEWQEVLDTNLTGVFHCTRQVSKLMIKQRHGIIINLTSIVGLVGNAGQANYSAAKAGVIGFTKAVAKELASRNIRVNAIAPGFIETDMTAILSDTAKEDILKTVPMGRMAKPEEVATVAAFLASEEAKYMTGQVLHVDGGMIM